MKPSTHHHPKPRMNRAIQYGAAFVAGLMVLTAPAQIMLTVTGAPQGFILSAFFTVLLAAPVLMLTAYAPAVKVDADGITLLPAVWKAQAIPWERIKAVKVYPLLPVPDSEVTRRAAFGRRYRPADGIMLVIPGLPPQYRIAGFFAGERAAPVVALTNRAHVDYDDLVEKVLAATDSARHDPTLFADDD